MMPLATKLIFAAVGAGLALFVILSVLAGRARTPRVYHSRIEPIGRRRYSRLWVVDRDEER